MSFIRSLISTATRAVPVLHRAPLPKRLHHDGPPQPLDNMPFSVHSRPAATLFFAIFFGIGFWAPFGIVWYQMIKRTL